ncbi:hypothetical protein [Nonomuraea sp. NPDC046570]|uniref:hypothetical protein n=1 Tax=Nonomuraea sp. NPDC046570 TaxID=3155255 RepID=UPI0034086375
MKNPAEPAPLYAVRPLPLGYRPADEAGASAAIEDLARAMNDLPDLWTKIMADVSPDDLLSLLTSLDRADRAKVLRCLGMKDMARCGPSLGTQVLARLRRARRPEAVAAAGMLGLPVIEMLLTRTSDEAVVDEAAEARWPASLRRMALWSAMGASAFDARVLLAVADRGWWMPTGLPMRAGDPVKAAAQAVVAVTGDLSFAQPPPEPAVQQTGVPGTGERLPEEARRLREDLAAALAAARDAVGRADTAVRRGAAPQTADLDSLRGLARLLGQAGEWLADQGAELREPTVPAATEAINRVEDGWAEAAWRQRLADLTRLTGPVSDLDRLAATVRTLLAEPVWDDDRRRTASGLLAVGELADLAGAPGGSAAAPLHLVDECFSRAEALPQDLRRITAMAYAGHLHRVPAAAPEVAEEPPPEVVEAEPPAETSPTENGVAALIARGRFGLAHAVATADGWAPPRLWALRVAALAQQVRPERGPCTARLRTEIDGGDLHLEPLTLLLAVPALLRAALITGEPAAGALLVAASTHVEPHLGRTAREVGDRALRQVLLAAPLVGVLADVGDLERRVAEASGEARSRLRPRRVRFQRAAGIAKRWLDPAGLLGKLLTAAADDDRTAMTMVAKEARRLAQPDAVNREIDDLDRMSKPVEGPSRQDLLGLAADTISVVTEWLDAVAALDRRQAAGQTWAMEEIAALRATLAEQRAGVLAGLADQARHADPLVASAATAGTATMSEIFALMEGDIRLSPGEAPAEQALTAELLKVPGVRVDSGRILAGASAGALLDAAAIGWEEALARQTAAENYPAAGYLIDLARAGRLPATGGDPAPLTGDEPAERLTAAEDRSRSELTATGAGLLSDLRRARARDELSDEQESELADALRVADPAQRTDLFRVRHELEAVAAGLSRHREEAANRLRERLTALTTQQDLPADDVRRVRRLIDACELATAEEHLYLLEIGEHMPADVHQPDVERFFPHAPEALPDGFTGRFLATVRNGERHAGLDILDYSALSADARSIAAEALELWYRLGRTRPEDRANISQKDLLPVMRLLGIEAQRAERRGELRRDKARWLIELTGVTVTGQPLVPAFGTKLGLREPRGGRLRVLLVWDRPAAELLMGWVDQDNSGDSILVAHFGTMPPAVRRRLAARAVDTGAPVAVIDDALIAYAVANGSGRLETTMALALPFSAVNPYVRHKRMLVSPEMFYGRDKERRSILDPDGTQVIFGGRGLGKSALLRESRDRFQREPGRVAVHLELNITAEAGVLGAGAVWDRLRQALTTAGVLPPPRKGGTRDAFKAVRGGVLDWLRHDSRRRLLILLDECDVFFESDAPGFHETNRLKELGLESNGRAKVVFAGLHSVQRFTKLNGNGPFRHLGQSTAIGPLNARHAFDLITRPLGALGFVFDDPELVSRVLNYCSYQPYLLQMFGHRLVETMHARRVKGQDGPPYTVTEADVGAVEADAELRRDITSAFRDTLNLDPRYSVIANVLAHHAYEGDLETRLSDAQLAEECRTYWPDGFAALDPEGFRSYLAELAGLGVLRPNHDGVGWRLRNSNALSMIGTRDEVVAELVRAESERVPPEVIARQIRRTLKDERTRWPLTIAQVNDVLGDHVNQVRLVLGSPATGIDDVAATLREVIGDLGDRCRHLSPGARRDFVDALTGGEPGQRRVVISDLAFLGTKPDGCWEHLRGAVELRPARGGVTRSVVLIASPATLPFWLRVFGEEVPELGVVTLRRYDRRTLEVWSLESGGFGTEEGRERLLRVTSGWPYLVERALELAAGLDGEDEALDRVEEWLSGAEGRAELVRMAGVAEDRTIAAVYGQVRGLMDPGGMPRPDLAAAASLAGAASPRAAIDCLMALGVFDSDQDGKYRLEPLLEHAWPHRKR